AGRVPGGRAGGRGASPGRAGLRRRAGAAGGRPARLRPGDAVLAPPPVALYGPWAAGSLGGWRRPGGFPGRACGWWWLVVFWLSCGVADGCDQEFQVLVVQAGDGVAEGDWRAFGDAEGEGEDMPFPAAEGQLAVLQGAEH